MKWGMILCLIGSLVLFFGCREDEGDGDEMIHTDDDDDNAFTIGDDDGDDDMIDDDAADDDAVEDMSCAEAYSWLYVDCEERIIDRHGNPFPLEDVIRYCQKHDPVFGTFIMQCLEENYPDCDAAYKCLEDLANGDDDDDDDDDDTFIDDDPVLSDGTWDPSTTELMEVSGYPDLMWVSALLWSVCDESNDLLPDGMVYVYIAGTTQPLLASDIMWSDLHDPPDTDLSDVDDCDNPVQVGILVLFGSQYAPPLPGTYCCDIEATDTAGNWSNKLTELCVTHEG